MSRQPTWGIVATAKAPAQDILNFAAYHLDLGAKRIFIYLDDPNPGAHKALKAHPKCRVIETDDGYWRRRRGRPERHQPRQTANASHCYNRNPQVDWLGHIDVDEFLWPNRPLPDQFSETSPDTRSVRIRPIEALADDPDDPPLPGKRWCKGFARQQRARREQTNAIYPNYGEHLNGGFLSHVAGKVFVRTGLEKVSLRIHNAFFDREMDQDPPRLSDTSLIHMHADSWEYWQKMFQFRMDQGSYRESLKPAPMPDGVALNMNQLFSWLQAEGGEEALQRFYREVCTATPELRARLAEHGHLHEIALNLEEKRAKHFPNAA